MIPFRRQIALKALKVFDMLVMGLSFGLTTIVLTQRVNAVTFEQFLSMRIKVQNFIIFMAFLIGWKIILSFFGLYRSRRLSSKKDEIRDICKATLIGTASLWLSKAIFNIDMIDFPFLCVFWTTSTVITIESRIILRAILSRVRLRGRNLRHLVIVGTNSRALEFAKNIQQRPELGYHLIGFVDDDWEKTAQFQKSRNNLVAGLKDFGEFLKNNVVDEVVIALPINSHYQWASTLAKQCAEQGIIVRHLADIFNMGSNRIKREYFAGDYLISDYNGAMDAWQVGVKRVFDIILSTILLIPSFPIMLIAGCLVKLTSPGPTFFIQERVGLNKRKFHLYKFRTMVRNAETRQPQLEHLNEASGPVFKITHDPRITTIGKFLRKTSIDELPQLFNVLKGDMSIVGPRPLPVRDYNNFDQDWHRRRFSVKPGITCLWQVNGRSSIPFEKWMALDMQYIDHWSLWLDLAILVRTVPAVLKGVGAT